MTSLEMLFNMVAREVFLTFMAPSQPDLWSFQFLKGNDVMLRVEDLLTQGVDGLNVLEIDSFSVGVRQSDVEVVSWSKDELSSLADLLQTTFPADHENVPTPPEDGL